MAVKIQGNLGICAPAYAPAMPLCGKQALAIMFEPAAAAAAAAIEFEVRCIMNSMFLIAGSTGV